MNYKTILNILGKVAVVLAVLLLLPVLVAVIEGEDSWSAFVITSGISLTLGLALAIIFKPTEDAFYSKDGIVTVAFSWILVSLLGALPFVISKTINSYVDALFETVSGFSTTGATILTASTIDNLYITNKAILFWRSFTHWIGGMGVIVFVMALVSGATDRSMHILRAEMPGPTVDKIVPRARNTAKILYLLYVGFTAVEFILLCCDGSMPAYDSLLLSFGTAGTGGFTVRGDGVAGYSAYSQWVIAVFMLLFGVNFNLYYLIILGKIRTALSSRELWVYLGIITVSAVTLSVNLYNQFAYTSGVGDSVRLAFFQTTSFISTTGYTTIPSSSSLNDWPVLTKSVLFMLMFIGGCAGSTGGGLKVSRLCMLCCATNKEVKRVLHPRNASVVKFERKALSDETLHSVTSYFSLYVLIICAVFVIISLDSSSLFTAQDGTISHLTTAVSCFNNIGPTFGTATSGMYMYGNFSKIVLTLAMLLGRLEIYPILLVLTPSTWTKN